MKGWKTVLYAGLNFLAALLMYLSGAGFSEDTVKYLLLGNGIIVFALRYFTDTGIFVKSLLLALTILAGQGYTQELNVPATVVPGKGFVVSYSHPAGSVVTWANQFPEGASRPFVASDDSGNKALVFIDSQSGDYLFIMVTQVPEVGADKLTLKAGLAKVKDSPVPSVPAPSVPAPSVPAPSVPAPGATKATYIYEKDNDYVPIHVLTGMNRLNRERGILATLFDVDTKNGQGQIPEQYKKEIEAAQGKTPCLVISDDTSILKIIPAPKTESEVITW